MIRTPIPSTRGFPIQTTYLSIMTTLKVAKKELDFEKICIGLDLCMTKKTEKASSDNRFFLRGGKHTKEI